MRIPSFVTLALLCVIAGLMPARLTAGEGKQRTFEIGRRYKIAPKVEARDDVPSYAMEYPTLRVAQEIPASTDYYTIHPKVRASGFSYFFHVRGYYGRFTVGAVVNLAKFIHEMAILEEIRHGTAGIDFRKIASRLRMDLDTESLDRELNIPTDSPEFIGQDESGADRSELGYGPSGEANRAVAYELGVDVYTSNIILKEVIRELGRMRTEDSMGWIPPSHVRQKSELNLLQGDDPVERRIRDHGPKALRQLVRDELENIFLENDEDQSEALSKIVSNPNHSPRNIAYIGADCGVLANVVNMSLLLPDLANASTPEEADMQTLQLRFYSLFHQYIQPIRGFMAIRKTIAAVGTNGVIYVFFWGDTMLPWRLTANSFPIIKEEAEIVEAVGVEFWLLGDADPKMVELADREGIVIEQNALYDARLRPNSDGAWDEE